MRIRAIAHAKRELADANHTTDRRRARQRAAAKRQAAVARRRTDRLAILASLI